MQKLKNIVRTISANPNAMSGTDSTVDVEKELAVYFDGGWRLFHVEVVGSGAGSVTILYVLVKDEPSIVPAKNEIEGGAKRGRPAKVEVVAPVEA